MIKIVLSAIAVFFLMVGIATVSAQSENKNACGNDAAWQQATKIDPSLVQRRQQMEQQIENYLKTHTYSRADGDSDAVRIIPTVFHIMEEGGSENIPDGWVRSCVNITNLDYRRQNADTGNTPAAFKPVAADTKIEFRLATKDPNGNCTNGIDRVFTHRTENFSSFGQALIDWPSDRYLNIWVAKTINGGAFSVGGQIIGYGQFPVSGPSSTDGVVLRADFVGDSAIGNTYSGRDGDHEIGHYLNMIHIWGDADCGDDQCADTPTQMTENYGCPTYPHITCGNSGDMSDNYMDYTDGSCKNIWTQDQKARMRATLDVARYTIWQQSNLVATGTDSATYLNPTPCAPNPDFIVNHQTNLNTFTNHISLCPDSPYNQAYFRDNSTNGIPTSWLWLFPGGTPSSSTDQYPGPVKYHTQGNYHVTLTVTNAQGSNTIDKGNVVLVQSGIGTYGVPASEDFEESSFPPWAWTVWNDDGGPAWQQTKRASYTGSFSASIQNHETYNTTAPGSVKELISPAYNFTHVTSPVLSFRLSYGQQYTGNFDSLSIGISSSLSGVSNCGTGWQELKKFASGSALSAGSGGFQPGDFAPTSPERWQLVTIPLTAYAGQKNVMFHFYFKTDVLSNNLYLDDINITGVVGIDEVANPSFSFDAVPNPSSQSFTINYELKNEEDLTINLYDIQGRLIRQIENMHESPGSYQSRVDAKSFNLASGVYLVRMATTDGVLSKKIIYSND